MTTLTDPSRKTLKTRYLTPTYRPVGKYAYALTNSKGNRYRVRLRVNGTKYDEYFTNKVAAMKFKKLILSFKK